jgi:hemolysin activation/secretion protein
VSIARIRGAVFVDTARAWQGDYVRDRTLTDAGAGVRMGLSGRGTIRLDVAHGLTDGANAVSMDWVLPWPRPW